MPPVDEHLVPFTNQTNDNESLCINGNIWNIISATFRRMILVVLFLKKVQLRVPEDWAEIKTVEWRRETHIERLDGELVQNDNFLDVKTKMHLSFVPISRSLPTKRGTNCKHWRGKKNASATPSTRTPRSAKPSWYLATAQPRCRCMLSGYQKSSKVDLYRVRILLHSFGSYQNSALISGSLQMPWASSIFTSLIIISLFKEF